MRSWVQWHTFIMTNKIHLSLWLPLLGRYKTAWSPALFLLHLLEWVKESTAPHPNSWKRLSSGRHLPLVMTSGSVSFSIAKRSVRLSNEAVELYLDSPTTNLSSHSFKSKCCLQSDMKRLPITLRGRVQHLPYTEGKWVDTSTIRVSRNSERPWNMTTSAHPLSWMFSAPKCSC